MRATIQRVPVGHGDGRRVIYDLIRDGNAGGNNSLHQLSFFNPVFAGSQIGGARKGYGHYHKQMWETYIIFTGSCVMSFHDLMNGEVVHRGIVVATCESPIRVIIPPEVVHRLRAVEDTYHLIAATGPQTPEDTFEVELPEPV